MRIPLTAERLRELLDYDPETGVFTWRSNRTGRAKAGTPAGDVDRRGYRRISISGVRHGAHRLAWLYTYGVWPSQEVDHINWQKDDNRVCNLREVSRTQNGQNRDLLPTNSSGFCGVSWEKHRQRWRSRIMLNGKAIHLGLFDTPEEAYLAYLWAAADIHTHNPLGAQVSAAAGRPPDPP